MSPTRPWIMFHAMWRQRGRSGLPLIERIQRFVDAVACDPAPERATVEVYEDLGNELTHRFRKAAWNPTTLRSVLDSLGYQPGPLVTAAQQALGGEALRTTWEATSLGFVLRRVWERERPFDPAPLIALYARHEADPPLAVTPPKTPPLSLVLSYWFDVKRPGTSGPLFPGAAVQSSVLLMPRHRHANVVVRYDCPEMTPELREANAEIMAALGPKTPRHAMKRVIPATKPGGRERVELLE